MPHEPKRDYYGETIDRIEPNIAAIDLTAAAASISISLRRLADTMEWFQKEYQEIKNKHARGDYT